MSDATSSADPQPALVVARDRAAVLERYLAQLPARSRAVLLMRFRDDLKQREIGAIIGISQMHVSRLIHDPTGTPNAAGARR